MASGFIVMLSAAQLAASGLKRAPYWLVATYFCTLWREAIF